MPNVVRRKRTKKINSKVIDFALFNTMNYNYWKWRIIFSILLSSNWLFSQSAREVSVEVTAALNKNMHTELRWTNDTGVIRYFVYKRPHVDSNWILLDSMLPVIRQYEDTNSVIGQAVEYRIAKKKNNFSFTGNGYIKAGFLIKENPNKGKILVLLDSNLSIPTQLSRLAYFSQLEREGFVIIQRTVLRTEPVANIRAWIFQQYQKDSQQIRCVLIIGHVPVPYSGDMSPDGHTEHRGAWPADNYYGSFYQNWTDVTVNRITASRVANRNSPGDGKFDLSRLNPVGTTWKNTKKYQLPVGRIDFYDMPAFGSDTFLLIRYFQKNLAFRSGKVSFSNRALIDDNFGYFAGEAFASGGYRNFSPFFGDSIIDADYAGTGRGMKSTDYLWSYGCGGGSYNACSGVSSSASFVGDSLLNPFTMVFGSYFGDWDNQNNFLRSPIASKGWGLVSVWAGRPYWMMHEAALGAPLYQCVKTSYNCANIYNVGSNGSGVHVALMGDPTLRVFPVSNVYLKSKNAYCNGMVKLTWNKPQDSPDSIRIEEWQGSDWKIIATAVGTDTVFQAKFSSGKHQLSIREKKLLQSASGTWWDVGARTLVDLSMNLSDSVKIYSNALKLCSGDTFNIRLQWVGNQKSKITDWSVNGTAQTQKDSVWRLASQGQGNLQIRVSVLTDSGCVSEDSIAVYSVLRDKLTWGGKTDSTISVTSIAKLPIQWYRNDTLIPNESDSVLRIRVSGIYRAQTLAQGFCLAKTDTLQMTYVPRNSNTLAIDFVGGRLYPNPADNDLYIIDTRLSETVRWKLLSINGLALGDGVGKHIDISALTAGVYLLQIQPSDTYIFIKK